MSVFLYYIQNKKNKPTPDRLKHLGLDKILGDDPSLARCNVINGGPDDKGGVIFNMVAPGAPQTGYYPDRQVWRECEDYWVGYDKSCMPLPEMLGRPFDFVIDGHIVSLPGGRRPSEPYLVPIARLFPSGETCFPQALTIGKDGKTICEPLPEYAGFCNRIKKLWETFRILQGWAEGEAEQPDFDEIFPLACEAIGINYHMGIQEISLLKLLDTNSVVEVLRATFDAPTIEKEYAKLQEDAKKKAKESDQDESPSAECNTKGGAKAS